VARAGCGRARSAWSIEVNCVGGHSRTLAHGHPLLGRADYSMDDATEGRSIGRMSWDEAFAERYDEWAAHMTENISFYVERAREALKRHFRSRRPSQAAATGVDGRAG
jgi:hypothetical protein